MAVPSATGSMRETLEAARTILARCAAFQTLVGATGDDATELTASALPYIYRDVINPTDSNTPITLPKARVWFGAHGSAQPGFASTMRNGSIQVEIVTDPNESYAADGEESEGWALNVLGEIVDQIMAQQGGALDHLVVRDIQTPHPPRAEKQNSLDPVWILEFTMLWGLQ